jgi:4-hydroxybenzoate polyprenyltransferase
MDTFLSLLRPKQWIKNTFVFLPLFFVGGLTSLGNLASTFLTFVAFCLTASGVYIFNDLMDVEEDRIHPVKKERPIAAGKVSKRAAYLLMAGIWMVVLLLCVFCFSFSLDLLLFAYVLLNILYSVKLKRIPIIDVTVIAVGFVMRLFAGSMASATPLTHWIIIMTFLLALFLGLAKRRDDVIIYESKDQMVRKNIDGYNLELIDNGMVLMAGVIIVAYIMYTVSPDTIAKFHSDKLYLTTLFVILGIMRYMQVIFVWQQGSDPTNVLFSNRFLQLVILAWIASFAVILYVRGHG